MKVYVGLSGGVDSSVAAALLQNEGHYVTGVYLKSWSQDLPGMPCPWKQDLADARLVAAHLDIPFKVFDFENDYRDKVVDYMVSEYREGRTPNPDIVCNQEVKFKLFLEAALLDGAEKIATGHYARVNAGQLLLSNDESKDQTYFLYRLSPNAIRQSLMPIGDYSKAEVRTLATRYSLPTALKKDSQGICFIGQVGVKEFLQQYIQPNPGPILNQAGKTIGQHDGAVFFTIGQRHGLGVGGGKPYYVIEKDVENNRVVVTDDPQALELRGDRIKLTETHWLGELPNHDKKYKVRVRHRGGMVDCRVELVHGSTILKLSQTVRALAPGQSAVIYDDERVVGGGIIQSAFNKAMKAKGSVKKTEPAR